MTREQAERLHHGDTVYYAGRPYRIQGAKITGPGAPYFRLTGDLDATVPYPDEDWISYRLCRLVDEVRPLP